MDGFGAKSSTSCLKQISSNQKCLILQSYLELKNFYAFLIAVSRECQISFKFEYLHSSFIYSMTGDSMSCVDCAMFYLGRIKCPSVLLTKRDNRVATTFPESQRLNLGNQYHRYASLVAPGIIEKF